MAKMQYPVLFMELEPGDVGYDAGYRYLLEQPDADRHFFSERHRADAFMLIHGLKAISPKEMNSVRAELSRSDETDPSP